MLKMAIKNAFGRVQWRPWPWGPAVGGADRAVVGESWYEQEELAIGRYTVRHSANDGWIRVHVHGISASSRSDRRFDAHQQLGRD